VAHQTQLTVSTQGQGLYLITGEIERALAETVKESSHLTGVLHCFLQHTSASLLIQENADPSAREDLEEFIDRLVPENQSWHQHLTEGPDDTVSHMKAAITPGALTIPVAGGRLLLGTWQGVYLWEHRTHPHRRRLILTLLS
jgi:secondary thiamine-phosphate synthase enzyme